MTTSTRLKFIYVTEGGTARNVVPKKILDYGHTALTEVRRLSCDPSYVSDRRVCLDKLLYQAPQPALTTVSLHFCGEGKGTGTKTNHVSFTLEPDPMDVPDLLDRYNLDGAASTLLHVGALLRPVGSRRGSFRLSVNVKVSTVPVERFSNRPTSSGSHDQRQRRTTPNPPVSGDSHRVEATQVSVRFSGSHTCTITRSYRHREDTGTHRRPNT